MQPFHYYVKHSLLILLTLLLAGCEPEAQGPEDYTDHDNFTVKLSAGKSIGPGQYTQKVQSGNEVTVAVQVQSPAQLKELQIIKTVNLEVDPSFGTNGTMVISAMGNSFDYAFQYTPAVADVDQLVGFTFKAVNAAGGAETSDLTVVVTLSPRDNLSRRRWALASVYHVNANEEAIKECEKDNSMLLNADSTVVVVYGSDTGTGDCSFDGFNVYTEWYLSEDEKQFTRKYYGIFSPETVVTEEFEVVTLTVDKLVLKQVLDLSALGLSTEETFLFTYVATAR